MLYTLNKDEHISSFLRSSVQFRLVTIHPWLYKFVKYQISLGEENRIRNYTLYKTNQESICTSHK